MELTSGYVGVKKRSGPTAGGTKKNAVALVPPSKRENNIEGPMFGRAVFDESMRKTKHKSSRAG